MEIKMNLLKFNRGLQNIFEFELFKNNDTCEQFKNKTYLKIQN